MALKKTVLKGSGIEVELSEVEPQAITEIVTASGKLQPEIEVKISADVSGEIIELPIIEGQKVKKGDLLVRIKPDIYEAAVSRDKASLDRLKSQLKNAEAMYAQSQAQEINAKKAYERALKLFDQGAFSQADLDNAYTQYRVAENQRLASKEGIESAKFSVKSAEATLNQSEESLSLTTIYSPIDGTVSLLNVEAGERVVGTAQMQGTEMMRVADLSVMEAIVEVNEMDIVRLEMKDSARIDLDAYPDAKVRGIVTEIANSSNNVSSGMTGDQVTNFEVKVRLIHSSYEELLKKTGGKNPFRPGMSAITEIVTESRENIIAVPILAVTAREKEEDEGKGEKEEIVFVDNNGKAERRAVKTGIQDDLYIEITEGLSLGETVISGPYSAVSKNLDDGKQITPKKQD